MLLFMTNTAAGCRSWIPEHTTPSRCSGSLAMHGEVTVDQDAHSSGMQSLRVQTHCSTLHTQRLPLVMRPVLRVFSSVWLEKPIRINKICAHTTSCTHKLPLQLLCQKHRDKTEISENGCCETKAAKTHGQSSASAQESCAITPAVRSSIEAKAHEGTVWSGLAQHTGAASSGL